MYIYICYYSVTQSSTRKSGLITAFAVRSALNWDSGQCSSLNQRIQGILFLRPQSCAFRIFGGPKIPKAAQFQDPRDGEACVSQRTAFTCHDSTQLRSDAWETHGMSEEQSLSSEGFMKRSVTGLWHNIKRLELNVGLGWSNWYKLIKFKDFKDRLISHLWGSCQCSGLYQRIQRTGGRP